MGLPSTTFFLIWCEIGEPVLWDVAMQRWQLTVAWETYSLIGEDERHSDEVTEWQKTRSSISWERVQFSVKCADIKSRIWMKSGDRMPCPSERHQDQANVPWPSGSIKMTHGRSFPGQHLCPVLSLRSLRHINKCSAFSCSTRDQLSQHPVCPGAGDQTLWLQPLLRKSAPRTRRHRVPGHWEHRTSRLLC